VSNPFSSRRVRPGAIPFLFPPGLGAAELVARLAQLGWRASIVGPHGSGKSTLLAALRPEIERMGCGVESIALRDRQRRLPAEFLEAIVRRTPTIAIIDGYEQLGYRSRWQLCRRCRATGAGLLITTHRRTSLPVLFQTATDFELFQRIVEHLVATGDDMVEQAAPIALLDLRRVWQRHGGNLRESLFDLYDLFEHRRIGAMVAFGF